MRVFSQRLEIADAVVAGPDFEKCLEGECTESRISAGAAARNGDSCRVGKLLCGEKFCRIGAVLQIDNAPTAIQEVSIRATVTGAAPVIHVGYGETTAGPV